MQTEKKGRVSRDNRRLVSPRRDGARTGQARWERVQDRMNTKGIKNLGSDWRYL